MGCVRGVGRQRQEHIEICLSCECGKKYGKRAEGSVKKEREKIIGKDSERKLRDE